MSHLDNTKLIIGAVRSILSENGYVAEPPLINDNRTYAAVTFVGVERYSFLKSPGNQTEIRNEELLSIKISSPVSPGMTALKIEEDLIENTVPILDYITVDAINGKIGFEVVTNIDFLKSEDSISLNLNRYVEGDLLRIRYLPEAE